MLGVRCFKLSRDAHERGDVASARNLRDNHALPGPREQRAQLRNGSVGHTRPGYTHRSVVGATRGAFGRRLTIAQHAGARCEGLMRAGGRVGGRAALRAPGRG